MKKYPIQIACLVLLGVSLGGGITDICELFM